MPAQKRLAGAGTRNLTMETFQTKPEPADLDLVLGSVKSKILKLLDRNTNKP
jgi:hypothetical protein